MFDEDVEGEEIRANFLRGVKGSIREAVGEEDIESDKEQELAEEDAEEAYWARHQLTDIISKIRISYRQSQSKY